MPVVQDEIGRQVTQSAASILAEVVEAMKQDLWCNILSFDIGYSLELM